MPLWTVIVIAVIFLITSLRLTIASERNAGKYTGFLLLGTSVAMAIWFIVALAYAPMVADGRFYALQEINCTDGGKIQVVSTEQGILNVTLQFRKTLDMDKRVYRKSAAPYLGIYDFGWHEWCYEK